MPERSDSLRDHLPAAYRRAVRALHFDYEITMISSLYWNNRAPWSVASRKCPDTFFLIPVQGTVRVMLGGVKLDIPPGTFLMLPENVRHTLALIGNSRRLHQFAIHCHIHDRWGRPLLTRFSSTVGRLPLRPYWLPALRELTSLMAADPDLGQARGENLIQELLLLQLSQNGLTFQPEPAAHDPRVKVVLEAMQEEMASPDLSIEALAQRVHITAAQLRKLFRHETGVGPKQFLNALRLRNASRLLRHSQASVKEVSALCGYASDHYFHLVFRRKFGCTPSAYRQKTPLEV